MEKQDEYSHKYYPCILCKKRTKPNDRKKCETVGMRRFLRRNFLVEASSNDILCNKCRHKYYKQQQTKSEKISCREATTQQNNQQQKTAVSSPPSISMPLHRTASSHAYCFVCRRPGPKLMVVPPSARFNAFLNREIIIPPGCRCCPSHIEDGDFTPGVLQDINTLDSSLLNRTTILELIRKIREYALKSSSKFTFDSSSMNSSDYVTLTSLTKENFDDLHKAIAGDVRNTQNRSSRMSLGIFLLKLRSGMSYQLLSTIFGISKSSLRRAMKSVRSALLKNFVPNNLGLQHISREEIITNHTRPLAQELFGNMNNQQVIVVLDGTYIYIQKSSNFQFQRRSYSTHKGRPLLKPMVVVSTDGYFLSVVGPYLADYKNNDASILNHMLKTNVEDMKNWFKDDDVFIVDRGFRDAIEVLEEFGIKAQMPCLLGKGDKQMSDLDANASRLVTKIRWVVEAANSRIKHWKYLAHTLPTNQVPYIGDYVRIVCAISNKYYKPLSSGNLDDDIALAAKMRHLYTQINTLKTFVEENSLDRRSVNWDTAPESLEFPRLDEEEIRNLTCGVYQLKLCPSYVQEYLDGDVNILLHKEFPGLIRVKLQSRHISSKMYLLWIQFTESNITAWYCRCRAGARVVGVCSHIASVIWYLGFAKYNVESIPGVQNWSDFVMDAAVIDESSSSESEKEE
ncbi:uncharacterized protein LOC134228771 [Saccostrea cucullata]|uniref:uncharacterized protein LOC134228771 n=1 Tax=Saccostrea cuccullata TaxID=36930 RepID=UPI002ED657F9